MQNISTFFTLSNKITLCHVIFSDHDKFCALTNGTYWCYLLHAASVTVRRKSAGLAQCGCNYESSILCSAS